MQEILYLITQMSPYLLLGFLFAGVMHAFVPQRLYRRYLSGNDFRSVVNATLLGIPLPLCSCGVIPTAMGLRREGASRGATTAFLIATPQTGVDSILATYSLLGLPFAIIRPIAALVTALAGGAAANIFDTKSDTSQPLSQQSAGSADKRPATFTGRVVAALKYGYVDMMQDIGRWLVLGLIIAGAITVFVPESFFALFADNSLLSILLVLLFAIPMYLCATGSIPIAVALMLKGLSPGAALVLLMAGPAVNAASILVIGKVMGRKALVVYLASIISGAVLFGLGIDYLLPREWFTTPINAVAECAHGGSPLFNTLCTVALALLLCNAIIRRYMVKKSESCDCSCDDAAPRTITLRIEGMRCNHCRANVEKAIAATEGVESVTVTLADGEAQITGTPNLEAIRKAVEGLGFKVV